MAAPVLWHITFSNFNEKARWALDYKGVAHRRREAPAGLHPVWALALRGGGRTFPLLDIDGKRIGDSTRIIEELERLRPDPPLYPSDPAERARALEIEDQLDEEIGHDIRRIAMDAVRRDSELAVVSVAPHAGPRARRALKTVLPPVNAAVRRYYDVNAASLERAWRRLEEAVDAFHAQLQPSGYLVGDRFSVADLTWAALIGSAAQPEGFPYPAVDPRYRGLPEVRSLLADRGVLEWVEEMYARHRGTWVRP